MSIKKYIIFGLIGLLALSNLYFIARKPAPSNSIVNKRSSAYPLLARRIFLDNPADTIINFSPVRTLINSNFKTMQAPHSVYFEYLPTGTSIRDQGDTQLIAASLVKLPVAMNLYHAAELGRIDLDKKIQLTEDDLDPTYGDLYLKGAGYSLTLREAAKISLTQSDNTADRAIVRSTKGLLKANEDSLPWLDIDYDLKGSEAIISARGYSSILKCLYFSCYLKPQASQEILSYLSNSGFNDRLTKGIPSSVDVAHKFGTYDSLNTYSDCGIFYVPQRSYILCIMMQGDEQTINKTISDVSKRVYDTVIML